MDNKIILKFFEKDFLHHEILKRAGQVFAFLAKNDRLGMEHLDMLWECSQVSRCQFSVNLFQGKGEDITVEIFEILREIAPYLSLKEVDHLTTNLENLQLTGNAVTSLILPDFTEDTLTLLKTLSGHAMDHTSKKKKKYKGLMVFWRLMQDDSGVER